MLSDLEKAKAVSVFCDHYAREPTERNNRLRAENDCMEDIRSMVASVRVYYESRIIREVDMIHCVYEENGRPYTLERFYCAYVEDAIAGARALTFPFMDFVHQFHCEILGIRIRLCTRATVSVFGCDENDKVIIKVFDRNRNVLLSGLLANVADHTKRRLRRQERIDCNRAEAVALFGGATFTIHKIGIAKDIAEPAQDCIRTPGPDAALSDDSKQEVEELLGLAEAIPDKEPLLVKVANDRRALECRNKMLRACRDLIQSVEVGVKEPVRFFDTRPISFKLQDGRLQRNGDGEAVWTLDFPITSPIVLPHMVESVWLRLGKIAWDNKLVADLPQTMDLEDGVKLVKYSSDFSMLFVKQNDLRVRNRVLNLQDAMRPLLLQIRLEAIQRHLDVLGIAATSDGGFKES